ncbi:MAG TPA: hypothetical protein VMY77_07720 [Chitinophagaceae bacterium]|nr:hypothetical protein [Chitinophagaceae bacterium]
MNRNLLGTLLIFIIVLSSLDLEAQTGKVNVTDFTVTAKEQKVIIDWKTDGATETNYFAIQKSTDGINFKTVALVMGPDPKQKNSISYGCSDKYVKNAKRSYYRVIHIDNAGNEQITEAKLLAIP